MSKNRYNGFCFSQWLPLCILNVVWERFRSEYVSCDGWSNSVRPFFWNWQEIAVAYFLNCLSQVSKRVGRLLSVIMHYWQWQWFLVNWQSALFFLISSSSSKYLWHNTFAIRLSICPLRTLISNCFFTCHAAYLLIAATSFIKWRMIHPPNRSNSYKDKPYGFPLVSRRRLKVYVVYASPTN